MRVIVTGGSGFIGSRLCEQLSSRGHEVVVLTREVSSARSRVPTDVRLASWEPGATEWVTLLEGAGGIVNLAGASVAQRWTVRAKRQIVQSRVGAAERLYQALRAASRKPGVLVNASAVGYYGPRGDETITEESGPGSDFLAATCLEWEAAARRMESLGLRVVRVRIGIVLGRNGGALARMLVPFRLGLGGPLGSGRQWMSWIHRDDLVELFLWALENPRVTGVLNGTAPSPVRMREFATTLGRALQRPSLVPVPPFVLKLFLGEAATIVLDGQRALPQRVEALGFPFKFRDVEAALRDVIAR